MTLQNAAEAAVEDVAKHVLSSSTEMPVLDDLCATLRANARLERFAMRQRMGQHARLGAFLRVDFFGWSMEISEAERAKATKAAANAIKLARDGEPIPGVDDADAMQIARMVEAADLGARPWEDVEKIHKRTLEKTAKQLPVWPWVEDIPGFGAASLGRLIGETGNLDGYANPAKVWKRLGLAVMDGVRQGGLRKGASAEDWIAHGYNRDRRSVSWNMREPIIRAQWSGEKVDKDSGEIIQEAGALGTYGQLYADRKAVYMARVEAEEDGWTKGRADRAARRYVEKRVVRDLWRAWRDA